MIKFRRAKSTDKVVDLKTFNDMQVWLERVANMTTDQYFNLTKGDPNYMLYSRTGASSSTMSYSDWAFGFSISGAVVTVNMGYLFFGKRFPKSIAGKDITITNDLTYIFVRYNMDTYPYVATIESSTTFPSITDTTVELPLHLWRVINGTVSLAYGGIFQLGNIVLSGVFSGGG
jgi:hypothetical protein